MEIITKVIGKHTFYLHPIGALPAARLSGDLIGLILPVIAGLSPAFKGAGKGEQIKDLSEIDFSAADLQASVATIDGRKVEKLLKQLTVDNRNISYEVTEESGKGKTIWLEESDVNDIFTGNIENLYLLAFEVVKQNFGGFFASNSPLFGNVDGLLNNLIFAQTGSSSIASSSLN